MLHIPLAQYWLHVVEVVTFTQLSPKNQGLKKVLEVHNYLYTAIRGVHVEVVTFTQINKLSPKKVLEVHTGSYIQQLIFTFQHKSTSPTLSS